MLRAPLLDSDRNDELEKYSSDNDPGSCQWLFILSVRAEAMGLIPVDVRCCWLTLGVASLCHGPSLSVFKVPHG